MIKFSYSKAKVAETVNGLAKARGIKQIYIADVLNISTSAMSQKMNAILDFKISELCLLSDFFGVSTDFLLGREDASLEVE
ncbi:helix-turn-helix domain-containing protein [Alloscardovia omnicolens]